MSDNDLDLTGRTIVAWNGERKELSGRYTAGRLADLLVTEWVSYTDCEKCGRHDYCKFTKPSPLNPERLADIRCGVAETALNNLIRGVFPLLDTMSDAEVQAVLDGSYYLIDFVYDAEQQIGLMVNDYYMTWLGEARYRASFFGATARLRRKLDQFAGKLRRVEAFQTGATVILTEGPSEKMFLEGVGGTGLFGLMDLDVQSYYGSGNRGPTKLKLLAERLHQQGYQLFIQGDLDGRARDIFQQLVAKGVVDAENTFAFDVDFESAFPPEMLVSALRDMGSLDDADSLAFLKALKDRGQGESVLSVLRRKMGVEVNKMELAEALAAILSRDSLLLDFGEPNFFNDSEIGSLLDKIRRLP